jgi:hypothetical protein
MSKSSPDADAALFSSLLITIVASFASGGPQIPLTFVTRRSGHQSSSRENPMSSETEKAPETGLFPRVCRFAASRRQVPLG